MRNTLFFWLAIAAVAFNQTYLQGKEKKENMSNNPVVVMETTQGNIEITLMPKAAPKASENFVKLAESGYYDGLTFHRIIKDFMIQGGDPTGTGAGGKSTWGAPFEDEFDADVVFSQPGILAMANAGPNTNGSQFFITTAPTPWLNNRHTIFGEVTQGMDVVRKLENVPTTALDMPVTPQKMIRVYVKSSKAAQ